MVDCIFDRGPSSAADVCELFTNNATALGEDRQVWVDQRRAVVALESKQLRDAAKLGALFNSRTQTDDQRGRLVAAFLGGLARGVDGGGGEEPSAKRRRLNLEDGTPTEDGARPLTPPPLRAGKPLATLTAPEVDVLRASFGYGEDQLPRRQLSHVPLWAGAPRCRRHNEALSLMRALSSTTCSCAWKTPVRGKPCSSRC